MLFLKLLLNNLLYTILMATAISVDENAENKWRNILNYQLSNNIRPFHYNLKITLMPNYTSGESNTIFYIKCAKPYIILHMPMLMNISEVKLKSIENKMIYAMNYSIYNINENHYPREKLLIIEPLNQLISQKYLKRGVYTLYFKFACLMNHDTRDFLQTLYTREEKDDGFIFATLIQPRRARQLFPCWDVTKLSATFNISVEHHKKYKVLSNMPVQEYKSVDNSTMRSVFQMTPSMSTYDVAIIMSDLYQVPNSTVLVNTWCRSQLTPHMIFMQYIAENIITYLKDNIKILKKISKIDYVVIPRLEDRIRQTWGLVLYNELDIIYNEDIHSIAYKTVVMSTIVRDIIFQWFGNLFDPFCRFHRLLNKGFITFFEIYVIKKVFPDSPLTNLLVIQTQHEALHLNSYFAMNSFAKNTSNISEIYLFPFSHIIGAAIWRMLNGILHNSILIGLNSYLNIRFTYLNSTTSDDLWNFMQTSIYNKLKNKLYNLSIKQIMDIWTIQTHCPVVNVIRNYSNNLVKISKEIHDELDRKPYFISVSYTKETNINFVNISLENFICLTQSNPEVQIYYDNKDKWFIANIFQTGYYRVNYDIRNWRMIACYLNTEKYKNIHVINRAQIIDDAFHLAIEKKLDFSIFWELAKYLSQERDYVAWHPMIKVFEHISSIFAFSTHDKHLKPMKIIIGSLFENIEEHIYNQTRSTKNDLDKYLKQELTKWGCLINNSLCVKMATEQFELHILNPETKKLLPGWKKLISCNGLKTVNYKMWFSARTNALNVYKKKSDYKMLKFLSCSDDPHTIFTYLRLDLPNLETMMIKDKNIDFKTRDKERVYALTADFFLSTFAMHVKNPIILEDILTNLEIIKNSRISTIATLIVIINNVYSKNELDMINKFAKNMTQLVWQREIECKITTRLLEIENQIKFYQIMFPQLQLNTLPTECPTTNSIITHSTTTHPKTTNKYRWDDLLTKLKFGIDKPLY